MTFAGTTADLVAAKGDKLFLDFGGSSGILNIGEYPDYVTDYWRDELKIMGGTGKFEGASGVLTESDYTTTIDDYTHHHIFGEITLVKGKR